MRLGRIAALSVVGAAVVAATPGSVSGGESSPRCVGKDTGTIAANGRVRVYRTIREEPSRDRVFACNLRSGRRLRLGSLECTRRPAVEELRLVGTLIGYSLQRCGGGRGSVKVVVRDVLTPRRRLSTIAIPRFIGPDGRVGFRGVSDMVLTKRGSVAWIQFGLPRGERSGATFEVRKSDAEGDNILLAAGTGIDGLSLALARDSTLYWSADGAPGSARLKP